MQNKALYEALISLGINSKQAETASRFPDNTPFHELFRQNDHILSELTRVKERQSTLELKVDQQHEFVKAELSEMKSDIKEMKSLLLQVVQQNQ
ncbi:hypothetical protein [Endozoicomonas sp. Mp262]|uniref:hypothetical protein n=1 Tax=Endozoicomonas sp. Mp262 TaxID=2919499 RepID=UPI0021D8F911